MTTVGSAADRAEALAVAYRIEMTIRQVAHTRSGTTDTHSEGVRFIPAQEYLDPELHRQEQLLLRRTPLVAAQSGQLPEPGSYRAEEVMGVPVLLARQRDGSMTAFLNSCAHRGARLADGEGVTKARFTCPYHAWSYGLTGELVSVTQPSKFGCFDSSCHGLTELPCDERHGLVFVVLDPDGALDLDEFLGDFADTLDAATLDQLVFHDRRLEDQKLNWKIALSTYFESYHVAVVHKNTFGSEIIGNQSTHDARGPHHQHFVTTWTMRGINDLVGLSDEEIAERCQEPGTNLLTVLFLFPNTVITVSEFVPLCHIIRVTPGATPGEQLTDFRIFARPGLDEDQQQLMKTFSELTVYALEQEDYATVAGTQQGLASGLKKGLHFGANEPTLTELHRAWAAALGRPAPDQEA
jgi:phenylpropionate dioxygenase-like ring-hydroxylating dioxygenase large terminal subunit